MSKRPSHHLQGFEKKKKKLLRLCIGKSVDNLSLVKLYTSVVEWEPFFEMESTVHYERVECKNAIEQHEQNTIKPSSNKVSTGFFLLRNSINTVQFKMAFEPQRAKGKGRESTQMARYCTGDVIKGAAL